MDTLNTLNLTISLPCQADIDAWEKAFQEKRDARTQNTVYQEEEEDEEDFITYVKNSTYSQFLKIIEDRKIEFKIY